MAEEVKNSKVKGAMAEYGMTQERLAELLGLTRAELNISLNKVEWSVTERNKAIRLIKENN